MTRPYFMQSARLGFGEWTARDLPLALDLWGDELVTRWIGGPFSEVQVRERLAREIETLRVHGVQYWPLFRLADGAHVGCCGLRPCPAREGTLEVGFHLKSDQWGAGYGTEAARAVIRHAFVERNVAALFAGHHPENDVSRALLRRVGFRYLGDEFHAPTGRDHPSYLLTKREWEESPSSLRVGEAQ